VYFFNLFEYLVICLFLAWVYGEICLWGVVLYAGFVLGESRYPAMDEVDLPLDYKGDFGIGFFGFRGGFCG
jgi:hypothetical protein